MSTCGNGALEPAGARSKEEKARLLLALCLARCSPRNHISDLRPVTRLLSQPCGGPMLGSTIDVAQQDVPRRLTKMDGSRDASSPTSHRLPASAGGLALLTTRKLGRLRACLFRYRPAAAERIMPKRSAHLLQGSPPSPSATTMKCQQVTGPQRLGQLLRGGSSDLLSFRCRARDPI